MAARRMVCALLLTGCASGGNGQGSITFLDAGADGAASRNPVDLAMNPAPQSSLDLAALPPSPDLAALPPSPDLAQPLYPLGPYGRNIGDTVEDFSFQGYRLSPAQTDSTKLPLASIDIAEIHSQPACKCLLLTMGAPWCTPCQDEQAFLVQAVQQDPSLCVLEMLVDGQAQGTPPTRADLDAWTQQYRENFPVGLINDRAAARLPDVTGLPTSVVIKPATMKILDVSQGFDPNSMPTAQSLCGN
jgi:thiol-disulfide isomerase/thioredoxin